MHADARCDSAEILPETWSVPFCLHSPTPTSFLHSPSLVLSCHLQLIMSSGTSDSEQGSNWIGFQAGRYILGVWRIEGDTTPVLHPSYSDQDQSDADVVLQTTDNVLFKVCSYDLKSARYVFLSSLCN
jgi:hypothetical protein